MATKDSAGNLIMGIVVKEEGSMELWVVSIVGFFNCCQFADFLQSNRCSFIPLVS